MSGAPPLPEAESVWGAVGRVYGAPGVEAACLSLQRDHGASVCTLLTLMQLAASGCGVPTTASAAAVVAESDELERAVLRPLRSARDGLKPRARTDPAALALRRDLLDRELALERYVLECVLARLQDPAQRDHRPAPEAVHEAAARYFQALPAAPDPAALQPLITAITPNT